MKDKNAAWLEDLILTCPYCGHQENNNQTKIKINKEEIQFSSDKIPEEPPVCLPYTRDIGRFDDELWGKIGQDFFSAVLGWERIGILRINNPEQEVIYYRVAECNACSHKYDVYLNFTQNKTLSELWPHLLGPVSLPSDKDIKRYQGRTRTIALFDKLIAREETDSFSIWMSSVFISLFLVIISLLPFFRSDALSDLPKWLQDNQLIIMLRILGGAWLSTLLLFRIGFIRSFQALEGFYDLLAYKRKEHVTHWLNYTLCRMVGVQPEESGTQGSSYSVTQGALIAGIPSVLLLVVIWIFVRLTNLSSIRWFPLIVILYMVGASWEASTLRPNYWRSIFHRSSQFSQLKLKKWLKSRKNKWDTKKEWGDRLKKWNKSLINQWLPFRRWGLVLSISALGAWTVFYLYVAHTDSHKNVGILLSDLFLWTVIAYQVGVSVFVGLNSSAYILRQVPYSPMHLDPLDDFRQVWPLENIAWRSTTIILTIVLGALLIISGYIGVSNFVVQQEAEIQVKENKLAASYRPPLFNEIPQVEQEIWEQSNYLSPDDRSILEDEIDDLTVKIVRLQETELTLRWLVGWISVGISVLLVGMGIAVQFYSRSILAAGITFILSLVLTSLLPHQLGIGENFTLDVRVMLTGLFLTYIIYVHTRGAYRPLKQLKEKVKEDQIRKYNVLLENLEKAIIKSANETVKLPKPKENIEQLMLSFNHLLELRTKVEQSHTGSIPIRRTASIFTPFLTSTVLPFIIEFALNNLLSDLLG